MIDFVHFDHFWRDIYIYDIIIFDHVVCYMDVCAYVFFSLPYDDAMLKYMI